MKIRRSFRVVILSFVALALLYTGFWIHDYSTTLARYGVFYKTTYGQSESLSHIRFYRDHNGVRHEGPEITGSWIYVEYADMYGDSLPEIVVKSEMKSEGRVVVKLNLSDDSKPPFDILEHGLPINYKPLGLRWQ